MVSAKVKASMLGDDGITLNYQDQLTDKDWSHYQENPKTKDGVVVFFDGFEVPAWDWWWEGMKLGVRKDTRAVEKDTKQVMQSGKNVQQTALHNESPQRVMSREELVGQRRRSWNEKPAWDEKPGTVHAFDARPPSQSTRTSLRSASSTREPSPLSMRSPVGSGHATPVLHDIHRRTTSTPLIPMYNEKQHQGEFLHVPFRGFVLTTSRESANDESASSNEWYSPKRVGKPTERSFYSCCAS